MTAATVPTAPKANESAAQKAYRYLCGGALTVTYLAGGRVEATCKGDSGTVYHLGFAHGGFHCTCVAMRDCSHLKALRAVVAVDLDG